MLELLTTRSRCSREAVQIELEAAIDSAAGFITEALTA